MLIFLAHPLPFNSAQTLGQAVIAVFSSKAHHPKVRCSWAGAFFACKSVDGANSAEQLCALVHVLYIGVQCAQDTVPGCLCAVLCE